MGIINMKKIVTFIKSFFYNIYLYKIFRISFYGLNLGSAGTKIPEFCSIDADLALNPDIAADIHKIKLRQNSVNYIYNSHVFEHIPRHKAAKVLREWYRVLKPGGKLYLATPDLEVLSKLYLENLAKYSIDEGNYNVNLITGIIFGGQTDKYDYHFGGYSYPVLANMLESIGFKEIKRFDSLMDGNTVEDAAFLAKVNGVSISLNIEAIK